ncbi:Tc toxin subunit A, partial [Enterobacter bugandensis]|uniref:Tc toxin subunit A n=1 Tax=Enterobacter bugandensis TaxID=881260 RepID=UPI0021CEE6AC
MSEHIQNMPLFAALAEKLNITTLSELADFSLEQVLAAAGDDAGHADCHALHAEAVRRLALSTTRERQAVTRANPQLLQAPHLGIAAPAQAVAYGNDFVPDRNDQFVKEGDVSSMFSPAAYLTEMYHNAEQLHEKGQTYHLDTRRPDLATLTLSQDNLDTPLSTLSLSNEILQATLQKQGQYNTDEKLHAALAENQSTPEGPYHHAFTGISEALRAREASPLTLLAPENRPAGHDDVAALCLALGISPALYAQLTTDITFENAKAEYKKVFGDTPPEALLNASALAARYNLPEAMFEEALARSVLSAPDTGGKYVDNAMSTSLTIGGDTYFTRVFRTFVGYWARREESITLGHRASGEREFTYISNDRNLSKTLEYLTVNKTTVWQGEGEVLRSGIARSLGKTRPGASTLEFNRLKDGSSDWVRAKFRGITLITECHSSYSWLLALHHQVLLHRALGLSLPLIARLQARHDDNTARVLRTAASLLRFQRDYALEEETAGTLTGLHLDVIPTGNRASQYDRVFNSPPLDGFYMSYGAGLQLEAEDNPLQQEDLKYFQRFYRALGLSSHQEFQMLNRLALNFNYLSNTQEWLSHLYRGKLLADIHGLTVSELSTLLPLLGVTRPLSDENVASVVDKVWTATRWLRAQNLSVAGLQALLTDLTPVQTPEISSLVRSLRN